MDERLVFGLSLTPSIFTICYVTAVESHQRLLLRKTGLLKQILLPFISIEDIIEETQSEQEYEEGIHQGSNRMGPNLTVALAMLFFLDSWMGNYYSSGLAAFSWVYASYRGRSSTYFLLILSFLSFIASISRIIVTPTPKITSKISLTALMPTYYLLIPFLSISIFITIAKLPVAPLPIYPSSSNQPQSPEDHDSTIFGSFCYSWMAQILETSSITRDDIFQLSALNRTAILSKKFETLSEEGSLLRRLFLASVSDVSIDFTLKLVAVCFDMSRPVLLSRLLLTTEKSERLSYSILMIASMFCRTISEVQHYHFSRRIGLRLKSLLVLELYKKVEKKRSGADSGALFNLLTTDSTRVMRLGCDSHLIYGSALQITLGITLLSSCLNIRSVMVGMTVLILSLPINYYIGLQSVTLTKSISDARDNRLSITEEVFANIQTIKFSNLNQVFLKTIFFARSKELRLLVSVWINKFMLTLLSTFIAFGIPISSFYVFTLTGEVLTVPTIFTSLALFGMIRGPLQEIPEFMIRLLATLVSIARLQSFLGEEEISKPASFFEKNGNLATSIIIEDASFSWPNEFKETWNEVSVEKEIEDFPREEGEEKFNEKEIKQAQNSFKLHSLSVRFPISSITLISGETAAGKTSLLLAILEEMTQLSGSLSRPQRIAYASQTPYLEALSIRANILFGNRFSVDRYREVLSITSLDRDILPLPEGDSTLATHLSGGQKSRIGLARAIYSSLAILLLDDATASLDAEVSKYFCNRLATSSILAERTIIVTSHDLNLFLPICQYHIQMDQGRIIKQAPTGTPRHHSALLKLHVEVPSKPEDSIFDSHHLSQELEERKTGAVQLESLKHYVKSSYIFWTMVLVAAISRPWLAFAEANWLKLWGESGGIADKFYLKGFIGIAAMTVTVLIISTLMLYLASFRSSKLKFKNMINHLIQAQFKFFSLPATSSRVSARTTSDVGVLDEQIAISLEQVLQHLAGLISSLLINIYLLPIAIIPSALSVWAFMKLIFSPFLRCQTNLNRILNTTTAPILAGFQQTVLGITTIRAYGRTESYRNSLIDQIDVSQALWYSMCTLEIWLSMRMQFLSILTIFAILILSIYLELASGELAIIVSFSGLIITSLDNLCNSFMRLTLNLNAVERIQEMMETVDIEDATGIIPPGTWLENSAPVEFRDVSIKYDEKPVISNLSIKIQSGERIGLVGRTGSGNYHFNGRVIIFSRSS